MQWPQTALSATDIVLVLVDTTAQEFMPATLMRIRGNVTLRSFHATQNTRITMKILYVEVNDAQSMTGDHSSLDTHEEDIAIRQLWTYSTVMPALDELGGLIKDVEIDVKAKLKLDPSGKKLLVLLARADSGSQALLSGYLRCLLHHG